MTALVLLALAQCVTPVDQAAGWKHTPVPAGSVALAAPEGTDQFRTGEPALVLDGEARFEHAAEKHVGSLQLVFRPPSGSQHLRVKFAHRLDGMEVDAAVVDRRGLLMPLLDRKRVGGDELRLDWGPTDAAQVQLTLHHHLRERPVVSEWRAGQWETVSGLEGAAEEFRTPGTLHWRHPGGRRVSLCEAPGQRLELAGTSSVTHAALTGRTP